MLYHFYLVLEHNYLVLDHENVPGELVLNNIILVLDHIEFGARSSFFAGLIWCYIIRNLVLHCTEFGAK